MRGLSGQVLREYFELGGSWSWVKDHVWGGGELLATVERTGTKHLHRDHLGSVRLETSRTGAVVASHSYWPFGEAMTVTSSSERYRFAGHERDQGTGYDSMHARYYAPMAGRFFSVDPGRDYDFSHPQSFNLYAHVRNNPVNFTDPDGRLANWVMGGLSGGGAEYVLEVVSNLIGGGGLRSFVEVDGRKIAASAALGAATSGLSALKIAGQGLSLGTKVLISAAGNLGEAQVHAALDDQALPTVNVFSSLFTGAVGEGLGNVGQQVARELSPKKVRALEREAKRLANIAARGRPRASQTARAAAAAERAAQYGAGPAAQAVREVLQKTADKVFEKTEHPERP